MATPTDSSSASTWGVFDSKLKAALDVDSCLDVGYTGSMKVSQFPVEKNGFTSYNKVREPYKAKVRVACGGDSNRMTALLQALESLLGTTELYTVVTPQASYQNATLDHYSYKRTEDKGQGMIVAELEFLEVREVTPQYATVALPASKTKNKGAASKVNKGKSQSQTPSETRESDASKLTHDQMFRKYYEIGMGA